MNNKEQEDQFRLLEEVTFKQLEPGIEIGSDCLGGMEIRLGGEFIYVRINYHPLYTNNHARETLARQIVTFIRGDNNAQVLRSKT